MAHKRNRSSNWEEEEKRTLRLIMKDYLLIIENKSLKTVTNKAKANAWMEIHQKFNELNLRNRDLTQLQIQWKGMKMYARKQAATKNGGEPSLGQADIGEVSDSLNLADLDQDDESIYDSDGHSTRESTLPDNYVFQKSQGNIPNGESDILPDNIIFQEVQETIPNTQNATERVTSVSEISTGPTTFNKIFSFNGKSTQIAETAKFDKDEHLKDILLHSKHLKEVEHKRRMVMAEEEHALKMKIKREDHAIEMKINLERLKCVKLEREILENKLTEAVDLNKDHSKHQKVLELKRRLEMAKEYHDIEMEIKRERLKCIEIEREILKYKEKL